MLGSDSALPTTAPRWIIVSDFEVEDALRLRNNRIALRPEDREQVERVLRNLEWIRRHYVVYKRYGGPAHAFGCVRYPHDMRYTNPAITIYERRR